MVLHFFNHGSSVYYYTHSCSKHCTHSKRLSGGKLMWWKNPKFSVQLNRYWFSTMFFWEVCVFTVCFFTSLNVNIYILNRQQILNNGPTLTDSRPLAWCVRAPWVWLWCELILKRWTAMVLNHPTPETPPTNQTLSVSTSPSPTQFTDRCQQQAEVPSFNDSGYVNEVPFTDTTCERQEKPMWVHDLIT